MARDEDEVGQAHGRPTERRSIEISVDATIRALQLVAAGTYPSFDAVVEDALSRLVGAYAPRERTRSLADWTAREPQQEVASKPAGSVGGPEGPVSLVAPLPVEGRETGLLPFNLPRLFPAKPVVRELLRCLERGGDRSNPGWVDYEEFAALLGPVAIELQARLSGLDLEAGRQRGERLATTLPSLRRDARLSAERYLEAYAGYVQGDGKWYGACPILGLTALKIDGGVAHIGLTEAGERFAHLENPVLNHGENVFPPFSKEEKQFLLTQIASRCPAEVEHMAMYLRVIFPPPKTREQADRAMQRFYERFWSPIRLTAVLVDSTRAAVHSRCVELGFAETIRKGRTVTYVATNDGMVWTGTEIPKVRVESI